MNRQRLAVSHGGALLAIAGAMYLSSQRNLPRDPHGLQLLPTLSSEINTVNEVSVRKGSKTAAVTVHKQNDQWQVAERANYPADVSKVRKLLLALSDAKIREEKTSNPESYSIIGVEDATIAGAGGAEIDLAAQDGKHAVIIGKSSGQGNYVRRANEKVSYIVEPSISVESEPPFGSIRISSMWRATKSPASSAACHRSAYSVRRPPTVAPAAPAAASPPAAVPTAASPPAPSAFTLDPIPKGRKALEPAALAPSPAAFGNVSADDVANAGDLDFSKPSLATVTLSDGSSIVSTAP